MQVRRSWGRLLAPTVLLLAAACSGSGGGDRPRVVPAGGTVTYRGKALVGAVVNFTNATANVSAYAKTGPDGRFTLTTFGHEDGAVPGMNKVSVQLVEVTDKAKPGIDYSTTNLVPPPPEEKWLIPKRYGAPETSGLTFEVKEKEKNDFQIELKD